MTTTAECTMTREQYAAICAVIDRVKTDDRNLDTDEYAALITTIVPAVPRPGRYRVAYTDIADDPFLVCADCGEHLCNVEQDDTLDVLTSVALEHEVEHS